MTSTNSLLTKSTSGASVLILIQFFTKLVTFVLNQLLIRFISPQTFGISIYLEFLVNTILFFSREGERLAIQRTELAANDEKADDKKPSLFYDNTTAGKLQSIINFGFIPGIIGIPIALILGVWQYHSVALALFSLPYIKYTTGLLALAILLELSIEPIYALNQYELNFKVRSKIEGLAIFIKCIVTFLGVYMSQNSNNFRGLAILCFAGGQFSYSMVLFACYTRNFAGYQDTRYSIKKIYTESNSFYYFNPAIFIVWKNLFIQMIFKHFLTEGDKLIINYWLNVEQQAVFAVVSNYGSILARLIFQPIEESMRLIFTRLLNSPDKQSTENSLQILTNLSIFYLNLTILLMLGGFTNGSFLLSILLKSKSNQWIETNVFEIFPQYIGYIGIMAFNGIFEAFFTAIATNRQIQNFSYFMSISCLMVVGVSYYCINTLDLGLSGLLIANSINMLLRISYCCYQIKKYYRDKIHIKVVIKTIIKHIIIGVFFQSIQYYINKTLFTKTYKQLFISIGICIISLLVQCLNEYKRILRMVKTKVE